MKRIGFILLLVFGCLVFVSPDSYARRARTLAFVPDPSCQTNNLIETIEDVLTTNFKAKRVKVIKENKKKAAIIVQYILIKRNRNDQVLLQLDGRAFNNRNGKLLAESTVKSDPHPNDSAGQKAAARQVARDLAIDLGDRLSESFSVRSKGHRVMIQVSLEKDLGQLRDEVSGRLAQVLAQMDPKPGGSTERNLVWVIKSAETEKDLAELIEQALGDLGPVHLAWVLQSKSTMILQLKKKE
jgi:hypothetical protein